jgi:hypothetical protein
VKAIFLEFSHDSNYPELAANGTDVIFHVDGRWSAETTDTKIHERVAELRKPERSPFRRQVFRGYSRSGDAGHRLHQLRDWDPPVWARPETRDPRMGW